MSGRTPASTPGTSSRPPREIVVAYLAAPSDQTWERFAAEYRSVLVERFAEERDRFDGLARMARHEDVYLGCSCPTKANPDVRRCHTWLALEFMKKRYPDLEVRFPSADPLGASPSG